MVYKIFYALCLLSIASVYAAAYRTGKPQAPFFNFVTKEPNFSGYDEINLGPQESLIYGFYAEHEDAALFLKHNLKSSIQQYLKQPIVISQELCTIMQEIILSFLDKHNDSLNIELQKMALVFLHPSRNKLSIHNIECINGKFTCTSIPETLIIPHYQRLFINVIANSNVSTDILSSAVADLEGNELARRIAAKHPDKLLEELLPKDPHIKSLISFSGYQWLKRARPTLFTDEYQQLSKKFHAQRLGKPRQKTTSLEKSILRHAEDTRAELLTFAAQLRMNSKTPTPEFVLDFLDDIIEKKKQQEELEQQTNRLLCFINLIS